MILIIKLINKNQFLLYQEEKIKIKLYYLHKTAIIYYMFFQKTDL